MKNIPSILKHFILISGFSILYCWSAYPLEIMFEEDSKLPLVHINVAVKTGSVTDPKGQSGLTNFMGEMLLRGTQARSKQQLDLALDHIGADLNVETRSEALIFRGSVLKSQLKPYLQLLKEVLTQPSFPETEIKKLKSEIISVLHEELGHDTSLAARRFTRFLFKDHPYGKPILGSIKEIEGLSRAQILSHYNQLIQDHLLLVVGSGDSTQEEISTWAKDLANLRPDLNSNTVELPSIGKISAPENPKEVRLLFIDKPDRTQTQINIGQIGILMTDRDYFPLHLGNYVFGGSSFSSILMSEIRVKRGWSYGANSYFRFGLEPRSWQVHLFPAAKDTPAALSHSLKLIRDLQQNGITPAQFEFAKRSLMNKSSFMYNTPQKRVENILLEKTLRLPDGFMKKYSDQLQSVTLANVNSALKKFLQPEKLAISVLGQANTLKSSLIKSIGISENQFEIVPYTSE